MKKLLAFLMSVLILASSVAIAVPASAAVVDVTDSLTLNDTLSYSNAIYENGVLLINNSSWKAAYVNLPTPVKGVKSFTISYEADFSSSGMDLIYVYSDGTIVKPKWISTKGSGNATVNITDPEKALMAIGINGDKAKLTINSLTYDAYDAPLYKVGEKEFYGFAAAFNAADNGDTITNLTDNSTMVKYIVNTKNITGSANGKTSWDQDTLTATFQKRDSSDANTHYVTVNLGKTYTNAKAFMVEFESAVTSSFGAAAVLTDTNAGGTKHYAHNAKQTIGHYGLGSAGYGMPTNHKTTFGFAFLAENQASGYSFPTANTMSSIRISGNKDGTTAKIKNIYVLAESTAVASVNGTEYTTIIDAISAANGTEYPIIMLDNYKTGTLITSNTVTIDLNGYTLNAKITVLSNGNITVTDTVGGGSVAQLTTVEGTLTVAGKAKMGKVSLAEGKFITVADGWTGEVGEITIATEPTANAPVVVAKGTNLNADAFVSAVGYKAEVNETTGDVEFLAEKVPTKNGGIAGFIYVNEKYHAMLVGGRFLCMPHNDSATGFCPTCRAEISPTVEANVTHYDVDLSKVTVGNATSGAKWNAETNTLEFPNVNYKTGNIDLVLDKTYTNAKGVIVKLVSKEAHDPVHSLYIGVSPKLNDKFYDLKGSVAENPVCMREVPTAHAPYYGLNGIVDYNLSFGFMFTEANGFAYKVKGGSFPQNNTMNVLRVRAGSSPDIVLVVESITVIAESAE